MKIITINIGEDEAKVETDTGLVLYCTRETAADLKIGDEIDEMDIDFGFI